MALKPLFAEDIPPVRGISESSPLHEFADDTVREFAESGDEAALVAGIPKGYKTALIANHLRRAVHRQNLNRRINVMQRKNEIYLKREY